MGEGIWRRSRHADREGARRIAAGQDAVAGRRLPRRGARRRDGRRVRLLPAWPWRRSTIDRHRDARPCRRRTRRSPPSRFRDRAGHRGRWRGTDQADLRRSRRVDSLASARFSAGTRHRRDQAPQPASHRHDPRRPRDHRMGRHLRRGRSAFAGNHRHRRALHRRQRQVSSPSALRSPATRHCRRCNADGRLLGWRRSSGASPQPTSRR